MAKIIQRENLIKIGKEPVVILPLKRWKELEASFEDMGDAVRMHRAIADPKNQKLIPLAEVKKRLKLP